MSELSTEKLIALRDRMRAKKDEMVGLTAFLSMNIDQLADIGTNMLAPIKKKRGYVLGADDLLIVASAINFSLGVILDAHIAGRIENEAEAN